MSTKLNTAAFSVAQLRYMLGLEDHIATHLYMLLGVVPGTRATSGRRSPERNRNAKGVSGSLHLTGRAVDVIEHRVSRDRAARVAATQRCGPTCLGIQAVIEADHLHLEDDQPAGVFRR